jgi:hypothetical protein
MIAPFYPAIRRKQKAWYCALLDGARKPELASSLGLAPRRTKTTTRCTPGSVDARFRSGPRLEGSRQPEGEIRREAAGERDGSEREGVRTPEKSETRPWLERSPTRGGGTCRLE